MFFRKKKKEILQDTPKGSCETSACSSCSIGNGQVKGCSTETQIKSTPQKSVNNIKHIIAIGSGKGGVGKSTITTNLAFALKQNGFKVGILDADIYGPSQAIMLGSSKEKVMAFDGMIRPIIKDEIKFISIANLNTGEGPTIWRAPIAIQAIEQFLHGVYWGELDFLLVDLPPGTGDIQLTLCQQINLSGALIVSTPQKVAAQVSQNGLKMFKQVNVNILGIIENMASFNCPSCEINSNLYKENYLQKIAKDEGTKIVSSIPLDSAIMHSSDEGVPVIKTDQNSKSSKAFFELSEKILNHILSIETSIEVQGFKLDADGRLELKWIDGNISKHYPFLLRENCRCALCVDEITGQKILDPATISKDLKITNIETVGRYGMGIHFNDGHQSGIYKVQDLREIV